MPSALYAYVSMAMVGSGIAIGVYTLGRNRPDDSPRVGMRGKKRVRAMEEGGLFSSAEPMVRMVAGWIAYFPIADQRRSIDEFLKHAGDWLGLTANEYLALCFIGGVGMGLFGLIFANVAGDL